MGPAPPKSKLPLAEFEKQCPKCEYDMLDIKYLTRKYDTDKIQEYLKSTCPMCGYQWNMQTADAKDRAYKAAPRRPGRQGPWCK